MRAVFWEMDLSKAPGPDGFSGSFYRRCWSIVKEEVVETVQSLFKFKKFVKEINSTFFCLIPNYTNPFSFDKYRPISLCNFSYKIMSKLLANTLKPLLKDFISPFQSAFVPGRWIAENCVLAQEIMLCLKKGQRNCGLNFLKPRLNFLTFFFSDLSTSGLNCLKARLNFFDNLFVFFYFYF